MNFSNLNVLPQELPTIEEVTFHPLEEDYLLVERISFGITATIFLAIAILLFYFIDRLQEPVFFGIAIALFIIIFAFSYIATGFNFKYSGYALREKDLLYRSGWINRRLRIVMLNRIQHVSVQSGPLERKFGLSSVSVYTAGASEADFTIRGITAQAAQNIKEWISTNLNGDTNK